MNKLTANTQYAAATAKTWALRSAHFFGCRSEPMAESIGKLYEKRADAKASKGRYAESNEFISRARRFNNSKKTEIILIKKEISNYESLAAFHEGEASRLRQWFDSFSRRDYERSRNSGKLEAVEELVPGVVNINALAKRLADREELLGVAENLFRAADFHTQAARKLELLGEKSTALRHYGQADTDFYKGLALCSTNLQLPKDFPVVIDMYSERERITVADVEAAHEGVKQKVRALSAVTAPPASRNTP